MTRPDPSSTQALTERLAELRITTDRLMRRNAELSREWAAARVRRSQIRSERVRIRADLAVRRGAVRDTDRRAAAAILEAALSVSGLPLGQLWLDYVALGGNASASEVTALISGDLPLNRLDHDRLALALNERLDEAGYGRLVAYWDGSR